MRILETTAAGDVIFDVDVAIPAHATPTEARDLVAAAVEQSIAQNAPDEPT